MKAALAKAILEAGFKVLEERADGKIIVEDLHKPAEDFREALKADFESVIARPIPVVFTKKPKREQPWRLKERQTREKRCSPPK